MVLVTIMYISLIMRYDVLLTSNKSTCQVTNRNKILKYFVGIVSLHKVNTWFKVHFIGVCQISN